MKKLLYFLKQHKNCFFNRYSLLALLLVIYSLSLYFLFPSKYVLKPGNFFSIALIMYFFWTSLGNLINLLPKALAAIIHFLISFLLVILMATGYRIFDEFHQFLSVGLLTFLQDNPVYFWTYFNQTIHNIPLMLLLLILTLLLFFMIKQNKIPKPGKKEIKLSIFLFIISITGIIISKHEYQRSFIPVDIHSFYAFYLNNDDNSLKAFQHLVDFNTIELPEDPRSNDEKYNIVLVVFESLSRVPLSFYGYDNNYTPFLHRWINKEKNTFVLVKNAMSISGATDASMPALYTGVGPEEPYNKLIAAPFLWDYAKKNGYHTIIATSQSQEWKNLKNFINDKFLDEYFYPEKLHLDLINDVGADDLSVVDTIKDVLLQIPSPYFFYYNTNATHGPYQDFSPKLSDFNGITNRYGKALYLTDKTVEKIVDITRQRRDYDKTFFIFLADHGDYTAKRRQRLSSFFKETLDIPMMIKVPEKWKETHPVEFAYLQKNAGNLTVTNLDVTPTIFQIIFDQKPEKIKFFKGNSLFDSINPQRVIIALSTNATRHYDTEGFGIYKGNESFIFHDNTGFHFYNIAKDSLQQMDLIQSLSPEKRAYFDSIYQNNEFMKAVYERHKNDFKK